MESNNIAIIIPPRERDLGGLVVQRVLPIAHRKMVGPFIFWDRMGPTQFTPGQGIDVRPHPHIGLATVTYLFEGEIEHRDSLGSDEVIRPGDINWMTAGSGIVHSERTPSAVRKQAHPLDGIQCWVALPREHEETEPDFVHHPERTLPQFEHEGVKMRLLIGSLFGKQSPVKVFGDLLYVDVRLQGGQELVIPSGAREIGVFLAEGALEVEGQALARNAIAVGEVGAKLHIRAATDARVLLLGGEPLGETREIWWNFVSSSKERIERAKADWAEGRFPKVPGDEREFIPLPKDR